MVGQMVAMMAARKAVSMVVEKAEMMVEQMDLTMVG
jgi:hypothetical protein